MTIDWTLPVETTEDPPRPVRVLFDKDGRPEAAYIADNGSSPSFNLFALEHIGTGISATRGMYSLSLRNVAPPKPEPVLIEGWINFVQAYTAYEGGTYWIVRNGSVWATKERALIEAKKMSDVICTARICVMSDGSPVPGEGVGDPIKELIRWKQECKDWKSKAEDLQAEAGSMKRQAATSRASEKKWADRWYEETQLRGKIEDDLAAARAFIREVTGLRSSSWKKAEEEYPEHAPAIAAARAEGGE